MDDLRPLLIEQSDDEEKIVDKVLVFLKRPTSEAKKLLRTRLEKGKYYGAERPEVLRSIIPIVPPSGHQFVKRQQPKGQGSNSSDKDYSQFIDDVAYFNDNFGGIGFWPVPLLGGETPEIKDIIRDWNAKGPLPDATIIGAKLTAVCTPAATAASISSSGTPISTGQPGRRIWPTQFSGRQ